MEMSMPSKARSALVLQGGGALGAYELGAARRLYQDADFAPDVIAGVSIGAITAVLLARPARGMRPLEALEAFWREVTMPGLGLPDLLQNFAALLTNPNFYRPRTDFWAASNWTSLYDVSPLRNTLEGLVDQKALRDPNAEPHLLVTATDIAAGEITPFRSVVGGMTLDHIIASGSLPPSFPMTEIAERQYWDGGLFDNTPLGAVLDQLDDGPDVDRTVYVVNLFPNKAPVPSNMQEVLERMLNLQFANRTAQDLKLLHRFDRVADLMKRLGALPGDHPVWQDPALKTAFDAVNDEHYITVPTIVSITRPQQAGQYDGADFSAAAIKQRAAEGYRQAEEALKKGRPR
jgi:predicted acylesterase/phospholipase RssA